MLVESSRLSTILNLNDSYQNQNSKRPVGTKTGHSLRSKGDTKTGKSKKPLQHGLNDWEYCNPMNFEDRLPMPFRLIDKIIYKDLLLKRVYKEIEEIEYAKLHHNYEGGVREVNPISFFELNGTSALGALKPNPLNLLLAGDKYGNTNILDLNRRIQLQKIEVVPSHRITAIEGVTIEYCDDYLLTFAIVARGEPTVHVYRIWTHDYKPVHLARINTVRSEKSPFSSTTKLGEFPYKVQFSADGLFLAVTLFNGSVEIYSIPEPPLIMPATFEYNDGSGSLTQLKSTTHPNSHMPPRPSIKHPSEAAMAGKQHSAQPNLHSIPTQDLTPFKKIAPRAPEKKVNVQDILTRALLGDPEEQQQQQAQTGKDEKGKKAAKKDAKKEEPKGQQPVDEFKAFELPPPVYEENPEMLMGESVIDDSADHSDQQQGPLYYPDIYYTYQSVSCQPEGQRSLHKEVTTSVTTDVVCVWHETYYMDVFELQTAKPDNAPTYFSYKNKYYIQNQANRKHRPSQELPSPTKAPEDTKSAAPAKKDDKGPVKAGNAQSKDPVTQPETKLDLCKPTASCKVLYPIKTSGVSKSGVFIALGLSDGSVVVWSLIDNKEAYQLDKHVQAVTNISFLDDWHLISGSKDGGLHLHRLNANADEELLCKKYQHVFKASGNAITKIEINETGLGFVMDKHANFRCYDLYHFEKLMKLTANSNYSKRLKLATWPQPLVSSGREQLVAVCDILDTSMKQQDDDHDASSQLQKDPYSTWSKNSIIVIYRTFESMANLLPGLASLLKKGFDKNKVMNAFTRLTLTELRDPQYDIPHFKTDKIDPVKGIITGKHSPTLDTKGLGASTRSRGSSQLDTSYSDGKSSKTGRTKEQHKVQAQRLTQEVLHPEQYLLQKRNDPGPALADSLKTTLTGVRERTSEKTSRVDKIQHYYTRIKEDLEQQEHAELMKTRKEKLGREVSDSFAFTLLA